MAKTKAKQPPVAPDQSIQKVARKPKRRRMRMRINTDGSMEVHHLMAELKDTYFCPSVELRDIPADGPSWHPVLITGTFKGYAGGRAPFKVTEKDLEDIVRNADKVFKRGHEIPLDYEHASEAPATEGSIAVTGAPAQGWIKNLEVRGNELWALIDFNEQARQQIKSKQYRYFSPAIRQNSVDKESAEPIGTRLTSVALTNVPFLDGLPAIAARDFDAEPITQQELSDGAICCSPIPDEYIERLRSALLATVGDLLEESFPGDEDDEDNGVADNTETQTTAADRARTETHTMPETTITLTEHNQKVAELQLQLKDATSEVEALKAENKQLKDAEEKRTLTERTARIDAAFAQYKDAKKLTDADKEAMTLVLNSNPALFDKLYPPVAQRPINLTERVVQPRSTEAPEQFRRPDFKALCDKHMKDGKSLEEATLAAYDEISTLAGSN